MLELNSNIIEYLPTWFRNIMDYQALCTTESQQMEALAQAVQTVADNFFFQTMDENAVQMWEQIFSIVPNPQTETLAFRQQRLINRIQMQPPFTLQFLYNKLDQLIGPGEYEINIDYPNYTLYILSSAENQAYAAEVSYTIGRIKPAHIVYINQPYTADGMNLMESVSLSEVVWNYKLGSWGLGLLPFTSTQEKEVIVVPSVYSIQNELLNDTAAAVSGNVASAQINGSIPISAIEKTTSGNVAQITYTVTPEQAALITQVALLDSGGNVLTTSPVYVPVTGNTILTHKITVNAQEVAQNG